MPLGNLNIKSSLLFIESATTVEFSRFVLPPSGRAGGGRGAFVLELNFAW